MQADSIQLYLASASPRRRELLDQLGLCYRVLPQAVDETPLNGEAPEDYVRRLALAKAGAARAALPAAETVPVLGADTAVVLDGGILGKPGHRDEGLAMLRALSGREHTVLTAVALCGSRAPACLLSRTSVSFRPLADAEMAAYWDSGEPADKAGAYGIQGRGALFVQSINGSYSGVVGLPLFETARLLADHGLDTLSLLRGGRP